MGVVDGGYAYPVFLPNVNITPVDVASGVGTIIKLGEGAGAPPPENYPDMFHALGRFIFKRQFWQNMMIYGTSEYCA